MKSYKEFTNDELIKEVKKQKRKNCELRKKIVELNEENEKLKRKNIGLKTTNTNLEMKLYSRYNRLCGEVSDDNVERKR